MSPLRPKSPNYPKKGHKKTKKQKGGRLPEEYAIILDILEDYQRAYVIGEDHFRLLEVKLKPLDDDKVRIGNRIYVGKGERDLVIKVQGKIDETKLSKIAKTNAKKIIPLLVERGLSNSDSRLKSNLLSLFNYASPSVLRRIGINSKIITTIINERDNKIKKTGKRFSNLSEIEETLISKSKWISIFDVGDKIAERICVEMKLIATTSQIKPFLLKFFDNPWTYVRKNSSKTSQSKYVKTR